VEDGGGNFQNLHTLQTLHNLLIIAREPDFGPGSSRSLQAVPPLRIVERGSGVRTHRWSGGQEVRSLTVAAAPAG